MPGLADESQAVTAVRFERKRTSVHTSMTEPTVDLDLARKVLQLEGEAIAALSAQIPESFAGAARTVFQCPGKVILTGVGKAGIVGMKISATLASTGTQSIFLHPVEALHGDLGRVQREDVLVALSHSGETDELIRLLDHIKARGATLIAITAYADSSLARHADVTICYGQVEEACPLKLAPTVSTSCMLALGDALAATVMQMRSFTPEEFAAFHPAGSLGRKLLKVEEAMFFKKGDRLGMVNDNLSLGEALTEAQKDPRRSGAMLIVDEEGTLVGILTDADLRRLVIDHQRDELMNRPLREVMTTNPKQIRAGELASEALAIFNKHRIDELPVVDDAGKPVGIIDVQDLLGIKTLNNGKD